MNNEENHPIDLHQQSAAQLASQLAGELRDLGVRPGDVLLVHTSLRALSRPNPEAVVLGLLEALGPEGTLLMPALSYETVGPHNPFFDVRTTPTCIGALPEYFRTRGGSVGSTARSVHPTHSVCGVGRHALEILTGHHLDSTPVGRYSPFAKLPHLGGKLLFLGCGLRPNTSIHGVEEHVEPPYLYGPDVDYQINLADGSSTQMTVRSHNFKGWAQRYDRLEDIMQRGLAKGPVLGAECYLIDAAEMYLAALTALRSDPLFFVEEIH